MFCVLGAGRKNILSHSTNEHIHLMYCLFVLPGLPVCCECLCPFVLINLLLQIKTSICWRSYLYLSSSLETWGTLSHRASAQDMCHMKMLRNLFHTMERISLLLCRFHQMQEKKWFSGWWQRKKKENARHPLTSPAHKFHQGQRF